MNLTLYVAGIEQVFLSIVIIIIIMPLIRYGPLPSAKGATHDIDSQSLAVVRRRTSLSVRR